MPNTKLTYNRTVTLMVVLLGLAPYSQAQQPLVKSIKPLSQAVARTVSARTFPAQLGRLITGQPVLGDATQIYPSTQFSAAVLHSYNDACRVQDKYPVSFWSGPVKEFTSVPTSAVTARTLPREIYPQLSLSSKQTEENFLIMNNRQVQAWLPHLYATKQTIQKHLPDFYRAKTYVNASSGEEMSWLARQLSPQTNYFLLGEMHFPEIAAQAAEFVHQLRLALPEREIILFTEFVSEEGQTKLAKYQPVVDEAKRRHIRVVGLEPRFVLDSANNYFFYRSGNLHNNLPETQGESMWASLEGVRIRNKRWLRTIRRYREQYPQALFMIYAGAGHVEYTVPYSLGAALAGPETFTAVLYPEHMRTTQNEEDSFLTSPFDEWTQGRFAFDKILQFNNKDLSMLAGFDAQIKIPRERD